MFMIQSMYHQMVLICDLSINNTDKILKCQTSIKVNISIYLLIFSPANYVNDGSNNASYNSNCHRTILSHSPMKAFKCMTTSDYKL